MMYTPLEVVKLLPALGLPPMPSPKPEAVFLKRVHKQGCPPEVLIRDLGSSGRIRKIFPIGMLCEPHTVEKKAYDYMVAKGVTAFYPSLQVVKLINGKRKAVTISRLPNIFFAHGTEDEIKSFVYDNVNLPFLRFYDRHIHIGSRIEKTPLIVPDYQMESLKIICAAEGEDIIISPVAIPKFEAGQLVRIVEGPFKGVVGRVARYHGQQRVAVEVNELVTVCTAYVPNGFLKIVVE